MENAHLLLLTRYNLAGVHGDAVAGRELSDAIDHDLVVAWGSPYETRRRAAPGT
jgi:hypothetical protein